MPSEHEESPFRPEPRALLVGMLTGTDAVGTGTEAPGETETKATLWPPTPWTVPWPARPGRGQDFAFLSTPSPAPGTVPCT